MNNPPERQRLFFALWPDDTVRDAIVALYQGPLKTVRGRRVQLHNIHITLAFLGNIDSASRDCMQQAVQQLRCESFELSMNQLGYWPRPKVVWLGPEITPPAIMVLQQQLVQAIQPCGFVPEKRAFHPHLTLMRKVQHGIPLTDILDIAWQVRDFVLVRSHTLPSGVEYEVVAHWPLVNRP